MSTESLAQGARSYTLVTIHPDGTQETISEHLSFEQGWGAGQSMTHQDRENAFSLYRQDRRVARFGHSRLMPKRDTANVQVDLALMGVSGR